jgi:hypothetical protein
MKELDYKTELREVVIGKEIYKLKYIIRDREQEIRDMLLLLGDAIIDGISVLGRDVTGVRIKGKDYFVPNTLIEGLKMWDTCFVSNKKGEISIGYLDYYAQMEQIYDQKLAWLKVIVNHLVESGQYIKETETITL